jgi:pimeloyl-ACP methyl ester carboxylesterase
VLLSACSSDKPSTTKTPLGPDGSTSIDGSTGTGTDDSCPVVVKDSDCDKTLRPFVFVHGTYGSGDNFAHVAALLASNGYCADRIVSVEYDSLGEAPGNDCTDAGAKPGCGKIDAAIDAILAKTGADKVDLAGHSQGTAHCGTYLGTTAEPIPEHKAKVAHYVNFSGIPDVGDVATLSISSHHDLGGHSNHATGSNVETFTLDDEDHFACAASTRSFVKLYSYLTGKDAKYQEVQCGAETVQIEGLSETFADNVPVQGKIEIREVGDTPRPDTKPYVTANPDENGHFTAALKRNVPYEFRGFDKNDKLIGSQYFTPFKRDNRLVRLLSPASADDGAPLMIAGQPVGQAIAAASTDNIVRSPNHVAVVARWAGGGFRQDLGASLTVNGTEVLNDTTAGAGALANTSTAGGVVGLFMYDANKNGDTDLGMVTSGPFLMFTDVFMDATKAGFVELKFKAGSEDANASGTLKLDNWPSSDATVLAMFQ